MAASENNLSGVQKAAILLIALGPEMSASVFKHLKEDEIEQLTLEIANTRSVSSSLKNEILDEFYEVCLAQQYIAEGGIGYAKTLLDKALGEDRAQEVIGRLTAKSRCQSAFKFYSGRTSTDNCTDSFLFAGSTGCGCYWSIASGKTVGCGKENCDHGSYISGCDQGSGRYSGTEAGILGKSGLHHCWRS